LYIPEVPHLPHCIIGTADVLATTVFLLVTSVNETKLQKLISKNKLTEDFKSQCGGLNPTSYY